MFQAQSSKLPVSQPRPSIKTTLFINTNTTALFSPFFLHEVSFTLHGDKAYRHNCSTGEKVVSPGRVYVWPLSHQGSCQLPSL